MNLILSVDLFNISLKKSCFSVCGKVFSVVTLFCSSNENENFQISSRFLIPSEKVNVNLKLHKNVSYSPKNSRRYYLFTPSTETLEILKKLAKLHPEKWRLFSWVYIDYSYQNSSPT